MEVKSYVKGVNDVCDQIDRILSNPEFDENTCLWQIEQAIEAHRDRCDRILVTTEAWA
ncbi:MAG: hypothetical protein ACRDCE_02640 [Cetobacterium sp.]|uniref:hypothetical protein n=1 Tax=Cetobacterium sp. TaxID=2071632 RepID=UPI003EE815D5